MKFNITNLLSRIESPLITKWMIKAIKYLFVLIAPIVLVSYAAAFWNWENGLIPKETLLWPYNILQTPTPLWLTIILISVALGYSYLKSSINLSSSPLPYKIKYFPIDNLKWKTEIHSHGYFKVDRIAICKEHDIPLINGNIVYYCPEHLKKNCNIKINNTDYSMLYEHAKSYIDKEVRKQ